MILATRKTHNRPLTCASEAVPEVGDLLVDYSPTGGVGGVVFRQPATRL